MSEVRKNNESYSGESIVELAFVDADFEDMQDQLRSVLGDRYIGQIFNGLWRIKSGYDSWRGQNFKATHIRCTLYDNDEFEDIDMVFVDWQDGYRLFSDTADLQSCSELNDTEDAQVICALSQLKNYQ